MITRKRSARSGFPQLSTVCSGTSSRPIDIKRCKWNRCRKKQRFFRKLLKGQGRPPWQLVTDKLRSYSAAHREVMPSVVHNTDQYRNNLAEVSHKPTRQRERQMRQFKTPGRRNDS